MELVEINRLLGELEEKFPVDEWLIDGVHVWPIVRIKLFLRARISHADEGKFDLSEDFLKKIWFHALMIIKGLPKFVSAYILDHEHNKKPIDPVDALLISDGLSFDFIQGEWHDRFCDPLILKFKEYGKTSCILTLGHTYKIPRHSDSMFIQPYLDFIKIKAFLLSYNKDLLEKWLPRFDEMLGFVDRKKLPFSLPDITDLCRCVGEIRMQAKYLKKIMRLTRPKVAIFSSYYDMSGWALNLACRDLGILSVDIQHGAQGSGHPAYSSWDRIPESGYELLPSIFWSWTSYEAKTINDWCGKVKKFHQPIVGGNLWLDFWKRKGNELVMVYDEKIKDIKKVSSRQIHVLVTLQTYFTEELVRLLIPVMKKSSEKISWWFREQLTADAGTQQINVEQILKEGKVSNYVIKEATEYPLGALLRSMDVLVTLGSSTIIDAESFRVPSVTICTEKDALFLGQFKSGITVQAKTPEDIEKAVQSQYEKWRQKKDWDSKQVMKDESSTMEKLLGIIENSS